MISTPQMSTPSARFSSNVKQENGVAVRSITSLLLVVQFVVFMACTAILGGAINWPASLNDPAASLLPLINAQGAAVALGYTLYLTSAALLIPIALLIRRVLVPTGQSSTLLTVSAVFGAIAGVLKLFGIVRWLFVMPYLADTYVNQAASRDTVVIIFNALNKYLGGIGEGLGVDLFAGLWTLLVGVAITRSAIFPKWLGWLGVLSATVLLVGVGGIYGLSLGPILTISNILWQVWLLIMAGFIFRGRKQI